VRIDRAGALDLTYCTNIHAADGWPAVFDNVKRYAPALKARLSPSAPFGVGLRLAAHEARQLLKKDALGEFKRFLDAEGLYVAILNGFPFGAFHGTVVKEEVYAPDWRDPARLAYTRDLIEIVRRLVPSGMDAGVSTAPLSYKAWMAADDTTGRQTIAIQLAEIAVRLVEIARTTGVTVHLDIEPEPDCLLETSTETVRFFEDWLLPVGVPLVASRCGLTEGDARGAILHYIRVCFDCCHMAVEYEDARESLTRLRAAGIQIGRIQLSSAIRARIPEGRAERSGLDARLRPFADSTYLHQVVAARPDGLRRFGDLDQALACHDGCGDEWRIHFHVPLFAREFDDLGSTQDYVADVIGLALDGAVTTHLEIETYTWDVLPAVLKLDLADSIAREYDWVLDTIRRARP
jgi:sugar phosphate isomerase/epimerase